MKVAEIVEGRTRLLVPEGSLGKAEPPTVPAFFNPAASTNRDITVAAIQATRGRSFCDVLSGVGARGIRVAREVRRELDVAFVEVNAVSLGLAKRSARINGVMRRCTFVKGDANAFLWARNRNEQRFDYVDVDPFGTPAPYLQGALNAVTDGGLISITATDTAVLCGVYPRTARRRYRATPLNNSFHHETAVRILVNACRSVGGALDIGVFPVLAHSTRHYIRAYLRAEVGASKADEAMKSEGYVSACRKCDDVSAGAEPVRVCSRCGGKNSVAGPLWVSRLSDSSFLAGTTTASKKLGFGRAPKVLESLAGVDDFPPYSFSLEEICSKLRVASVSPEKVGESLWRNGFRTHVQPFEKTGLKTDAAYADVVSAVREASR